MAMVGWGGKYAYSNPRQCSPPSISLACSEDVEIVGGIELRQTACIHVCINMYRSRVSMSHTCVLVEPIDNDFTRDKIQREAVDLQPN